METPRQQKVGPLERREDVRVALQLALVAIGLAGLAALWGKIPSPPRAADPLAAS